MTINHFQESGHDGHDHYHDATEDTPLLASSPTDAYLDGDTPWHSDSGDSLEDDDAQDDGDAEDKPMPILQIILLCYARLFEPVAFFGIFPYINQMLQRNGSLSDTDVGFYSGLIESLFALAQMFTMLAWSMASNRFGRKPIFVVSLIGASISTSLFGLSQTIPQMILLRCFSGCFSGTIILNRVMVFENCTPKTEARIFSWFSFAGNMGIFLGPLIGGAVADPVTQYPEIFAGLRFFQEYPYSLSSFAVGLLGISAAIPCIFLLKETLPADQRDAAARKAALAKEEEGTRSADSSAAPGPKKHTFMSLIREPSVRAGLSIYAHVLILAFAWTAINPVFWFTPASLGGFGFTQIRMSIFMGCQGLAQAVWLLVVFPWVQGRIGTNGVLRVCSYMYPVFFATMPMLNGLLRLGTPAATTAFWVIFTMAMIVGPGVAMAFTGVQLMMNDVSPDAKSVSTVNSIALTLASALRSFEPALSTCIFAFGVKNQWLLWGHLAWAIMLIMALGLAARIYFRGLPSAVNVGKGKGATTAQGGAKKRRTKNRALNKIVSRDE